MSTAQAQLLTIVGPTNPATNKKAKALAGGSSRSSGSSQLSLSCGQAIVPTPLPTPKDSGKRFKQLDQAQLLILQAHQVLNNISDSEAVYQIRPSSLAALNAKLKSRLSPEYRKYLTEDWEPGTARTRGAQIDVDLEAASSKLSAAEPMVT